MFKGPGPGPFLFVSVFDSEEYSLWSGWNFPAWCSRGWRPLITGCLSLQRLGIYKPILLNRDKDLDKVHKAALLNVSRCETVEKQCSGVVLMCCMFLVSHAYVLVCYRLDYVCKAVEKPGGGPVSEPRSSLSPSVRSAQGRAYDNRA